MKIEKLKNKVIQGDCLEELKKLPDSSVDSIVTDPPYELGFMGKSWDSTGIANNVEMWAECLRVLKPGGHLLSFGGTRTYHRMASAIEDAGFEVRDMIEWVYASGFPKSLNIGKAVDKLQGNEREDLGYNDNSRTNKPDVDVYEAGIRGKESRITKGTSAWEGWGTALKPAHEPIVMARKPLSEKTVAENCLKWGTGGINIDESRVEIENEKIPRLNIAYIRKGDNNFGGGKDKRQGTITGKESIGRFPSNLIHDNSEEVRECFPETKSGNLNSGHKRGDGTGNSFMGGGGIIEGNYGGDSGNASRFFKSIYRTEKDIEPYEIELIDKEIPQLFRDKWVEINELYKNGDVYEDLSPIEEFIFNIIQFYKSKPIGKSIIYQAKSSKSDRNSNGAVKNIHPTCKPTKLMEYLINTVTKEGQTVLDPFAGSGATLIAAKKLGRKYIGIELEPKYVKIAEARLRATTPTLFTQQSLDKGDK